MTTTTTAETLARELARTHDLTMCPILADALEESGNIEECDATELRAALVHGRAPNPTTVGKILIRVLGVRTFVAHSQDSRNRRRRTRTVSVDHAAHVAACRAVLLGRAYYLANGGGVPNSYGYSATTDGVLVAARYDPESRIVYVMKLAGELPANKVTDAGVAGLFGVRDLCDERVSGARREAAEATLFTRLDGYITEAQRSQS